MPTRQAVWPDELMQRRGDALALEQKILSATQGGAPSNEGSLHAQLQALLTTLAELPCPHWDVETLNTDQGDWSCVECHDIITPMWVAIAEQEQTLRRATHQQRSHRRTQ